MRALLVVIAAAACGGHGSPAAHDTAGPGLVNTAEHVDRPTLAPTVRFADGHFTVDRLPAVARGGEVVVLAVTDGDGGRGNPNLRIEVKDRHDTVLQKLSVMTANELETIGQTPAIQKRLDDANALLARLHGMHDLQPMHALEVQKPAEGADPHLAIGDNLDVDWNKDHVHVFVHNTDRELIARDGHGWLAPPQTFGPAHEPCTNPAFLRNAYHAAGINRLVIVLAFKGTDLCWEPGDAPHVIAW